MKLNNQAQQVIEYLVVVAAVVAGVLGISNPSGPMRGAIERSLNGAISTINQSYVWRTQANGNCSVTCGLGTLNQNVWCQRDDGATVADSYCEASGVARPPESISCNAGSCTSGYNWVGSGYGACSAVCGGGVQTQTAECHDTNGARVDDAFCSGAKPVSRPCNQISCYSWQPTQGACNVACGVGTATVTSTCQDLRGGPTSESNCDPGLKPAGTTSCDTTLTCGYQWVLSAWSGCSQACGLGEKTRTATCMNLGTNQAVTDSQEAINRCGALDSSQTVATCNLGSCYSWALTGGWSACSSLCDDATGLPNGLHGTQSVNVECKDRQGNVVDPTNCEASAGPRPSNTRDCPGQPACGYSWGNDAQWSACDTNCGTGSQSRGVWCTRTNDGVNVPVEFCQAASPGAVQNQNLTCSSSSCTQTQSCTGQCYKWQTVDGACSTTCGTGTMSVTVSCVATASGTPVDPANCLVDGARPLDSANCTNTSGCTWVRADTGCLTSGNPPMCGTGTQTVSYACHDGSGNVVDNSGCGAVQPMPTDAGTNQCQKISECCGNTIAEPSIGETCANCSQDMNTYAASWTDGGCGANGCQPTDMYQYKNASCPGLPAQTQCTAGVPACNYQCAPLGQNATWCPGSPQTNLAANTPVTYRNANACTGSVNCEAQCGSAYYSINGGCALHCGNGSCENGLGGRPNYGETLANCSDCDVRAAFGCASCPNGSYHVTRWWLGSDWSYDNCVGVPGLTGCTQNIYSWLSTSGWCGGRGEDWTCAFGGFQFPWTLN